MRPHGGPWWQSSERIRNHDRRCHRRCQRIGEACARRLAAEGHVVAILDTNSARGAEVATDLKSSGATAESFAYDVSNAKTLEAVAQRIESDLGPVDVLIPRGGHLTKFGNRSRHGCRGARSSLANQLPRQSHTARAFGRKMVERGSGSIVFIGSTNSMAPFPLPAYSPEQNRNSPAYGVACGRIRRCGVRVNGVAPTYTLTPALKSAHRERRT